MGNCVFKRFGVEIEEMVKVVTTNGGIMELYAPITAQCITNEFPGHAIYRNSDHSSPPLLHDEELHGGHFYYLLPVNADKNTSTSTTANTNSIINSGTSCTSSSKVTPYRMSFDNQRVLKRLKDAEVFPTGVWKVKLVICPAQLAEILAQEARTEELIESVRTVAKCGNGVPSSLASSDQWSVSSSWKGSAEKYGEDYTH